MIAEELQKGGKDYKFTATHHSQSLKLAFRAKFEHKEQRPFPALVTAIAEEAHSAHSAERLARCWSYLSLRSAVAAVPQEYVWRPAVMEMLWSLGVAYSPYLTGLTRRRFPNT